MSNDKPRPEEWDPEQVEESADDGTSRETGLDRDDEYVPG